MALPTITVNLGELLGEDGEPQTLAENIVSEGARQLVQTVERDLREEVRQSVKDTMKERISAAVDQAFQTELYETDSYGQRRANAKMQTITELIIKQVHEYLGERVNKEGRTDWGERNWTRAQWIALSAAEAFVKTELEPAIKQAKSEVKKAIGDKLSEAFKKALQESVACVC